MEEVCNFLMGRRMDDPDVVELLSKHRHRTVCKDGEYFILTMDMRHDRLNLTINEDVITHVDLG